MLNILYTKFNVFCKMNDIEIVRGANDKNACP